MVADADECAVAHNEVGQIDAEGHARNEGDDDQHGERHELTAFGAPDGPRFGSRFGAVGTLPGGLFRDLRARVEKARQ